MADREAIRDLFADYAWANDAHDDTVLARVLAEDATFNITIAGLDDPIGPFEGRTAVVEFISGAGGAQTDQRRHVITNYRFENESDDRVDVRAYLSLHVIDGGVLNVISAGVYKTTVVLDGSTWRFAAIDLALDAPF